MSPGPTKEPVRCRHLVDFVCLEAYSLVWHSQMTHMSSIKKLIIIIVGI